MDGEEVARMPYSIRHSGILVMESSSLWITGDAGHGGEYVSGLCNYIGILPYRCVQLVLGYLEIVRTVLRI